jgi:uncharacterized protein (DUF924 family)
MGRYDTTVLSGGYDSWKEMPRGCLVLMILVEQFPRNVYRHTIYSFDGYKMARTIVNAPHD